MTTAIDSDQKLHLVFGGELQDLDGVRFRDIRNLDIVGIFPDYASAQAAWRAKAQAAHSPKTAFRGTAIAAIKTVS